VVLAIDSSALVTRYVDEPASAEVTALMDADRRWCASDLVRCETSILLARLATSACQAEELTARLHADWDAIHLAAATRLPRPVRLLTLDPRQVLAAVALDLEPVPTPDV
jgi:uncharacterized protein with PIN domain